MDDVLSDMSVFHGVDDIRPLPASVFFPRMFRLPTYRGAVAQALVRDLDTPPVPHRAELPPSTPPPEKPYEAEQIAAMNRSQLWGPMGLQQQTGVFDLG
ncbi:hypothetical protein ACFWMR_01865 [Amycolatopsis thailandensis]|uniref:hypothetical protein n=1 Tax=Amycolatopsis thailandensis TaxID=589330 RepID=UPI003645FB0F